MRLTLILRPSGELDIQNGFDDFEAIRVGLGIRFVTRVREVFEQIEAMPEMYGLVWQDVRAARLKQFRLIVYYIVFVDRIEVLAVLHGTRHDSAWRSRVKSEE